MKKIKFVKCLLAVLAAATVGAGALQAQDKVKVGVRFMGRQIAHKDLGIELLEKFQAEIGDGGTVEQPIRSEGRSMHMILAPPKKRK